MVEDNSAVVGIDIGGTKISAALFGLDGQMMLRQIRQLNGRKGSQVAELAVTMVRNLIQEGGKRSYRVKAIGVCVPGIYNPTKKTVWAPNIPGWQDYPLYDDLVEGVKDACLSIFIESDRSCCMLGEVWKGNAQECNNAIFIAVGTGIGAGILSNGNIITGNTGIAGAIGWLALEPPYEEKYRACGNFEYYASGNGIARSAVEEIQKIGRNDSLLAKLPLDSITSQDVFEAYAKKDFIAVEVVERAILYWGMTVANLISIFNPEKVIFGGGVFGPAANWLDRIVLESRKWAQPVSIHEVSVEVSALKGDAGLIGAGYLALKSLPSSGEGK